MNECKYCLMNEDGNYDDVKDLIYKEYDGLCSFKIGMYLGGDGKQAEIHCVSFLNDELLTSDIVSVNYCPMCGRKLD